MNFETDENTELGEPRKKLFKAIGQFDEDGLEGALTDFDSAMKKEKEPADWSSLLKFAEKKKSAIQDKNGIIF